MTKNEELISIDYLKECVEYDHITGILKWKHRPVYHFKEEKYQQSWNKKYANTNAGSLNKDYIVVVINYKKYKAQNIGYALFYGYWPSNILDHKNEIKSDNKIDNLRVASTAKNSMNTSIRASNKSGYKGVCWDTRAGKWRASITKDYKHIGLGFFLDKEDAHKAYCQAADRLFGEFANYG